MGRMKSWGFLATIIASQQIYFGVREFVRYGIRQLESKGLLQERRAQFLARREFLERVMKVRLNSTNEKKTTVRRSNSQKKDRKITGTTTSCSSGKTKETSVDGDRSKDLDRCLNMGLDIIRQQPPEDKKKR